MYLTPADYRLQIRSEIKALLKGESDRKLDNAETAAVKMMRSYLARRYDVDNIFFIIHPHSEDIAYRSGQYFWYKPAGKTDDDILVYKCVENAPAGTPVSNGDYFEQNDPRDAYINTIIVDLVIFLLHSKDSQRVIPEVRQVRYDDAIAWLREVGAGKLDADLPQKATNDPTYESFVRFSSYPRENQRY